MAHAITRCSFGVPASIRQRGMQSELVFHALLVNLAERQEMPGLQVGPAVRVPGGNTRIKRKAVDQMRAISACVSVVVASRSLRGTTRRSTIPPRLFSASS